MSCKLQGNGEYYSARRALMGDEVYIKLLVKEREALRNKYQRAKLALFGLAAVMWVVSIYADFVCR